MSDIPISFPDHQVGPAFGASALAGQVRARRELALFCHPVAIFLAVWLLMLLCLGIRVSYVIYPHLGLPVLLFGISLLSFLVGYGASGAIFAGARDEGATADYVLDLWSLRRINLLLCAVAILIVAMNWITSGPPPAISDPSTYLTYGRLKQILFPVLSAVMVNATLDRWWVSRLFFLGFGFAGLAVYVTRSVLLVTFVQIFFLFLLRTRASKRAQYLFAALAVAFAVTGTTVFGNLRTAHAVFMSFMQIREQFSDWPMAWLWVVSYVSVPFSNLCWVVAQAPAHTPTLSFLYPMLPTFLAPASPYTTAFEGMTMIDNASTYLITYVLDFSLFGVYLANLALGAGCRWTMERLHPRRLLLTSLFLTALSFLFFTDMFLLLSTAIQALIFSYVETRCFSWSSR